MNTSNSLNERLDNILDFIGSNITLSDYEKQLIKDSVLNMHTSPDVKQASYYKIEKMLSSIDDLNYILLKVKSKFNKLKDDHDQKYNLLFTGLVRKLRPSTAAIESEIYSMDKSTYNLKKDIDNLLMVKDYIESLVGNASRYISYLKSKEF